MKKAALIPSIKLFVVGFAVAVVLLGISLAVILVVDDPQTKVNFMDLSSPVVDFTAAFFLFIAANKFAHRSKRLGLARGIIAWHSCHIHLAMQPGHSSRLV